MNLHKAFNSYPVWKRGLWTEIEDSKFNCNVH